MKAYILVSAIGLSLAFGACRSSTVVTGPPPPVVVKVRPAPPSPRHVWVNGNYVRRGNRYVWQQGYYTMPPSYGQRYVEGYWVKRRGHYVWVNGYWR